MKALPLAAAALAGLCAPTLAATTNPNEILRFILSGDFPEAATLVQSPFKTIVFDGPEFTLSTTTLAEVEDAFGGTVQKSTADNGGPQSWLCYDANGVRTWFYSGLADKSGKPLVNLVVEEKTKTSPKDGGCAEVGVALTPLNDLPGIGATLAELTKAFGADRVHLDGNGHLNLTYQAVGDVTAVQNIFYIVKDSVVTSVAFSQWNVAPGDTL